MSKTTDVIVVGSGLAGLMAAWAAAKKGASVKVISEGMGNLAISPGTIDLLGYDADGKRLEDPWAGLANLPADHPYSLLGKETIAAALGQLVEALATQGYAVAPSTDSNDKPINTLLPTIMGTLKPTWLAPHESGVKAMATAKRILIISIKGFRDCKPQLIASQLRRYPGWESREYETLVLPAPFNEHGRAINALDLAHFLDRPHGRDWLMNRIKAIGKNHDLVLIPPMLGSRPDSPIRKVMEQELGAPYLELISVPPGVGGLRIRESLVNALVPMGVEFYENARIISSDKHEGKAISVKIHSCGRETTQWAKTFVVATGGIIGGGVILDQGKATEAIFGLDIPVPSNVDDWSEPALFGKHLISRLGVSVDKNLQAPSLSNVYFAGRTLGGYDYAAEKSGHGVACATGWHAGNLAAEQAQGVK